jgi:glycerol-3-phosphate acyltransferase PlsY
VGFPIFLVARWLWTGVPIAENLVLLAAAGLLVALIFYLHRANIRRLLAGTEPKVGQKREQTPTPAA